MPDNVVYADKTSLFTLKGSISVEFMDGEVLVGEFATQDAFNIFVKVNNDLLMIPRQQIRFIKGTAGQQIERDTSQHTAAVPSIVATQPLPEPSLEAIAEQPISDQSAPDLTDTSQEEPETENGTLILVSDSVPTADAAKEEEEEGTLILVPGADIRSSTGLESDQVLAGFDEALSLPDDDAGEELEMTVVLDDTGAYKELGLDEDDVTIALGMEEETPETAVLTVIKGPHTGDIFTVHTGITTMGRSSDNVVVLSKDKEISRHHAILLFEAENFIIQDQNSLNGTFVNDEPITGPHSLRNGDIILVGVSHLKFEQ